MDKRRPKVPIGQIFGRWTVLEDAGTNIHHDALWKCRCACGKEANPRASDLRKGASQSCGCLAADRRRKAHPRPTAWLCSHTDTKHFAKGMCRTCYKATAGKKRYDDRKKEMGIKKWREYRREMSLRRKYHLPWNKYKEKLKKQNYRCICGQILNIDNGKIKIPHIDHNHKCCSGDFSCGKCIRGILCFRCNVVLGFLEHEPHLLPKYLEAYLAEYPLY
jgi:hypothetical protein